MNRPITPRCPVTGCTATKFANVAIENEKPEFGGKAIFVIQCEYGHIIGPSVGVELRGLLEHQNRLLAEILKKLGAAD
jgi:hypothetical protein